jgi:uncharacterized membrane protein (DUF485 family)
MTQVQENVMNQVEDVFQPSQESEKAQDARYDKVYDSEKFQQLVKAKRRFIVPLTMFYIAYGMLLPFLAFYTDVLDIKVIGNVTLGWIYGMSVVVVSLIVSQLYIKRAEKFDQEAKSIVEQEGLL